MTVHPESKPASGTRSRKTVRLLASLVLATGLSFTTASADEVIRIMAANTTSGNGQDYNPGEGIRIFQGLDPDIVLIQEFNYLNDTTADFRDFVDTAFGTGYQYFREPGGEQIPNGIISRFPILQSGEWVDTNVSNRDFAWAKIDIPGDIDLWAVSVHFLTTGSGERNAQATALVNFIQANVPATDYLVVGGDFNTNSFSESALGTLSAVVNTSGRPKDQNNVTGTNASRANPYDQILPDPDLVLRETAVVIGGHMPTYSNGLVFDSRVFTPLSAVAPVLSGDSGAPNMQHMAVIRDFLIPAVTPPAEPASHATDFAGNPDIGSISLTWADAATTPGADGYLIRAGTDPSITAPADGVAAIPDADLSDGSATSLVPAGQQAATFTGLPADTTYHFKIYPYADGTPINYKTDGSVPALTIATLPDIGPLPAAPVLGAILYPHAAGFTITWSEVPGATGYHIDVSRSPTFTGGSSTLLAENFDAGTSFPTGWIDSGTANDNLASHYGSPANCRALSNGDTLVTPEVDFPGELSFRTDASNAGNGKTATISHSIDGGEWLPLSSFAVSTAGNIETITLTGTPKLDDLAKVRFRFESGFDTWYLDDLSITSSTSPGFVAGYQDLPVGNTYHHAITGLDPDTAHYFRVRAINANGTGPDSATGTGSTRLTGTPFTVWAGDSGIAAPGSTSDFDHDSLTDYEEYLFATDPAQPTSPSDLLQFTAANNGSFQVTHRKSLAPGIQWIYQGSPGIMTLATDLVQGTGPGEYQILSTARFSTHEQVTLSIDTAGAPGFFFRLKTEN